MEISQLSPSSLHHESQRDGEAYKCSRTRRGREGRPRETFVCDFRITGDTTRDQRNRPKGLNLDARSPSVCVTRAENRWTSSIPISDFLGILKFFESFPIDKFLRERVTQFQPCFRGEKKRASTLRRGLNWRKMKIYAFQEYPPSAGVTQFSGFLRGAIFDTLLYRRGRFWLNFLWLMKAPPPYVCPPLPPRAKNAPAPPTLLSTNKSRDGGSAQFVQSGADVQT